MARELDSNTIKLPITLRDNHKTEKKNCISISLFGYKDYEKHPKYVLKIFFKRHVYLLMIGEEDKLHYVLIKDFNTFVYDHVLRRGRKHFCPDFSQDIKYSRNN